MTLVEGILIAVVVALAIVFMVRRTMKKYDGVEGGCGSKRKSKNVSLTIGGEPVKRR